MEFLAIIIASLAGFCVGWAYFVLEKNDEGLIGLALVAMWIVHLVMDAVVK